MDYNNDLNEREEVHGQTREQCMISHVISA